MTTQTPTPNAWRAIGRQPAELVEHTVLRRDMEGEELGEVALDPEWFGVEPNAALLHQVVTAQLAAARAGTHSTRRRSEARGGGAKPYRQKGTGRARQGSIRATQWVGGGIPLGPKPRDYRQRTPKKMVRAALVSALSDRAAQERVALVDRWAWDTPRTKDAIAALENLTLDGRVLVVLQTDDEVARKSFANLELVDTLAVSELNAHDVVRSDWVVFTDATLPGGAGDEQGGAVEDGESAEPGAGADSAGVAGSADVVSGEGRN